MKNFFKLIFILSLLIGTYHLSQSIFSKKDDLITFKKEQNQIKSYPTTKEEKFIINRHKGLERTPASIQSSTIKPLTPKSEDSKWQKQLSQELLRFQDDDTKVIIENLNMVKYTNKDREIMVRKVIITYLFPNNRNNSATALVDIQTGKLIKAWNHTKHEDLSLHSNTLRPTNI